MIPSHCNALSCLICSLHFPSEDIHRATHYQLIALLESFHQRIQSEMLRIENLNIDVSTVYLLLNDWLSLVTKLNPKQLAKWDMTLYVSTQDDQDKSHKTQEKSLEFLKSEIACALQDAFISYSFLQGNKLNQQSLQAMMIALNRMILEGNHLEVWDMCLVNNITIPYREPHPFAKDSNRKHALAYERLVDQMNAKMSQIWKSMPMLIESIKISLIVDSMIIDWIIYQKVIATLNQYTSLNALTDYYFIEVTSSSKNPNRRIYLSPITRLYLERLVELRFPNQPHIPTENISKEFIHFLSLSSSHYPRSLQTWVKAGKNYLMFSGSAPGMIIHYLKNIRASFSLQSERFEQLFAPNICIEEAKIDDYRNPELKAIEQAGLKSYSVGWREVMAQLDQRHTANHLKEKVREDVTFALTEAHKQYSFAENEKRLIDYAISLLKDDYPSEPTLIKKKLQNIGPWLIGLAKDYDISLMNASERLSLYNSCLEMTGTTTHYASMNLNLVGFEQWLCNEFKLQGIAEDDEFFEVNSADISYRVNANIVTFDEYQAIVGRLDMDNEEDNRIRIILLLGFKLGLRRSEVTELAIRDYYYCDISPQLIIRDGDEHTLKTHNAKRTYVLSEHMLEEEWRYLNTYFQKINALNYSHFLKPKKSVNLKPLIDKLMIHIKEVTKQPQIKFHQLRHSKASFELLAAYDAQFELGVGDLFFSTQPATREWLIESRSRYIRFLPNNDHVTKASYWLHEHMGHGSLSTTLGHYVHFMDMVTAAMQIKHAYHQLTQEQLSTLGLFERSTYFNNRENLFHFITNLHQQRVTQLKRKDESQDTQEAIDKAVSMLNAYPCYQYQQYLYDKVNMALIDPRYHHLLDNMTERLKENSKLFFLPVRSHATVDLLTILKKITSVYGLDLQSYETQSIHSHLADAINAFDRCLEYRSKKSDTNHLGFHPTNRYEIICSQPAAVLSIRQFMNDLDLETNLQLLLPTNGTQSDKSIQQYWRNHLSIDTHIAGSKKTTSKYGLIRMTLQLNGQKQQVVYAAIAMVSLWLKIIPMLGLSN